MPQLKRLMQVASCAICGINCYLECCHCWAILSYVGQEHTCTDPDETPGVFTPVLCDPCGKCTYFIIFYDTMIMHILLGGLHRRDVK